MTKPFVAFTKTCVTRLYNSAETKNTIIKYLEENSLIKRVDGLFLSTNPIKRTYKSEIGFLKLFPTTRSPQDMADFEIILREKVGLTLDDYVNKVLNSEASSTSSPGKNNMFNTLYHKWLLNRLWYEKLQQGHLSEYFRDNIVCPSKFMNQEIVTATSVSHDAGMKAVTFSLYSQLFCISLSF